MNSYKVCICETISQEFMVIASDPEQALVKTIESYHNGTFTVDDPCIVSAQASIVEPEQDATSWINI